MYCEHFGFSEKPFDMTPDPKYLYLSPSNKEVFASLIYGIRERRGFISIVGEVGTDPMVADARISLREGGEK